MRKISLVIILILVVFTMPNVFASSFDIDVAIPSGNSLPGCEKTNICFMPSELIIFQGQTVTWINMDSVVHTVTSGDLQKESNNVGIKFNSASMDSGEEFSHTFSEVGDFPYFCLRHPRMTGVVIVQSLSDNETGNSSALIPSWIKNNAKWWSENQIDDNAFVEGIQFLINENIIRISGQQDLPDEAGEKIPGWIKKNAGWWADGLISEGDFVKGIKRLVENGIIQLK